MKYLSAVLLFSCFYFLPIFDFCKKKEKWKLLEFHNTKSCIDTTDEKYEPLYFRNMTADYNSIHGYIDEVIEISEKGIKTYNIDRFHRKIQHRQGRWETDTTFFYENVRHIIIEKNDSLLFITTGSNIIYIYSKMRRHKIDSIPKHLIINNFIKTKQVFGQEVRFCK